LFLLCEDGLNQKRKGGRAEEKLPFASAPLRRTVLIWAGRNRFVGWWYQHAAVVAINSDRRGAFGLVALSRRPTLYNAQAKRISLFEN